MLTCAIESPVMRGAEPMSNARTDRIRLAVFASGGGSNFEAIVEAVARGALPLEVALCLSDRPEAGVLGRARRRGIPTAILTPRAFADEGAYVAELLATLERRGVTFIALAGYLKLVPAPVVRAFHGRMLNVHPALLPAFGGKGMYGMRVHRAVLAYGVKWTGATVHLVDEAYDTGPIVAQEPVPVRDDDTPEALAARVLEVEHRIYPEALRFFAEGRVRVEGRRVRILDAPE